MMPLQGCSGQATVVYEGRSYTHPAWYVLRNVHTIRSLANQKYGSNLEGQRRALDRVEVSLAQILLVVHVLPEKAALV